MTANTISTALVTTMHILCFKCGRLIRHLTSDPAEAGRVEEVTLVMHKLFLCNGLGFVNVVDLRVRNREGAAGRGRREG